LTHGVVGLSCTSCSASADVDIMIICGRSPGRLVAVGNESVPILLTQCRFPGLAISSAEILIFFSKKIYGSSFVKQHSETVMV